MVDSAHFTVTALDSAVRSGAVLLYKLPAAGYIQNKTIVSVSTTGSHGLQAGDSVWINFNSGNVPSGQYQIVTVPDPSHFTFISTNSASQTQNNLSVYPLKAPPLIRSGTVVLQESSWIMGASDSDLSQTPLQSPTVFNFFFARFSISRTPCRGGVDHARIPAGLGHLDWSSDEFFHLRLPQHRQHERHYQLPGQWLGGDGFGTLDHPQLHLQCGCARTGGRPQHAVVGGWVILRAKTAIVLYVANAGNFPYSAPPTDAQMLNRVRAVVHMILLSPDYNVQK